MHRIRAISFDLDDTLWEIEPVILRAERMLRQRIEAEFPKAAERFDRKALARLRQRVVVDNPHLSHDLTELRRLCYEGMLQQSGYHAHHSHALMEQFFELRHELEFFPEVESGLERLSARFRLFAVSNGNADLERLPISRYFEGQISARTAGVGKPDTRIFAMACEAMALAPAEVLHIGDHPHDDIRGALNAGLKAAWLNRRAESWDESFEPHIVCEDLCQFANILEQRHAQPA